MATETTKQLRDELVLAQKNAVALLATWQKLSVEIIKSGGEIKKAFSSLNFKDSKDIAALNTLLTQSTKLTKQKTEASKEEARVQKEKLALDKQLKAATDEEVKGKLRLQAVNKANRDALRDELILLDKSSGTLKKLAASNRKLRREREGLNIETKKGAARLIEINTALDKNNAKIEANSDKLKKQRLGIGRYSQALGKLRGTLISVANAAGVTFGIFGAVRVLKSSFNIIRDFDQAMQNLESITRENTDALRELAKELGGSTVFTAGEAADAMTELAKAGFNTNQILAATPGVLSLAAAGNLDLARTADIASNVLTGFGLNAEELDMVVDVLARTATSTNTTIETIGDSFKEIAPTARNLKIPITEVAAAVGLLGNSGIKGTNATNVLNTALNRLSKPTKEMIGKMEQLNLEFFDSNGQFIGITNTIELLNDRFEGLTDKQRANAISTLFGAKANKQMTSLINGQVTAMEGANEVVLEGAEALRFLTEEYENAEGAAKEMADTQIDSVGGSVKLLISAWERYVLGLDESIDASSSLKDNIKLLAENFETVVQVVKSAIAAFIAYKVVMIATNAVTKANIAFNVASSLATNARTLATQAATIAQKAFNAATKANPIGFLLALLAAAAVAYGVFSDAAADAAEAQKALNKIGEEASKGEEERIKKSKQFSNERLAILSRELEVRRAQGEDTLKLEEEFAKARSEEILKRQDEDNKAILKLRTELFALGRELAEQEEKDRIARASKSNDNALRLENGRIIAEVKRFKETFNEREVALRAQIKARVDNEKNLNQELLELGNEQLLNEVKQTQALTKEQIAINKALGLLNRRLIDLRIQAIHDETERSIDEIHIRFKREIDAITENSKVEIALRKELIKARDEELGKVRREQAKKEEEAKDKEFIERAKRQTLRTDEENELLDLKKKTAAVPFEVFRDEELKKEEDALQKRKEIYEESINQIEKMLTNFYAKQDEEIDKDLEKNLEAQSKIRAAIESGSEGASESLAAEERKQAELEKKKEQTRKKAQRAEAAIALLKLLGENSDQPNAIGKTIADYGAILAAIQAAPSFFVGTDDTGKVNNGLDSNGGRMAMLHDNEQVWSKDDRSDIGFRTREQIKDIVAIHERGLLTDSSINVVSIGNESLILEVKKLNKSMVELPGKMPIPDYDYDKRNDEHITTIRHQNKVTKLRKRANRDWSVN